MALLLTPPCRERSNSGGMVSLPRYLIWPDVGDPAEIKYLLVGRFDLAELLPVPNLKFLMPMFASIDHLIAHPDMPGVPVLRTGPPEGDPAMTEYAVLHVLRHHRHMPDYLAQQCRKEWKVIPQKLPRDQRIGFVGFDVASWTRTERQDPDITMFAGEAGLASFLARTDILVCLLPLTAETAGILNIANFAKLPEGAAVINLGRGAHLVDEDLIGALDSGTSVWRDAGRDQA